MQNNCYRLQDRMAGCKMTRTKQVIKGTVVGKIGRYTATGWPVIEMKRARKRRYHFWAASASAATRPGLAQQTLHKRSIFKAFNDCRSKQSVNTHENPA